MVENFHVVTDWSFIYIDIWWYMYSCLFISLCNLCIISIWFLHNLYYLSLYIYIYIYNNNIEFGQHGQLRNGDTPTWQLTSRDPGQTGWWEWWDPLQTLRKIMILRTPRNCYFPWNETNIFREPIGWLQVNFKGANMDISHFCRFISWPNQQGGSHGDQQQETSEDHATWHWRWRWLMVWNIEI